MEEIQLPRPRLESAVSLEETLAARRSVREYAPGSLSLDEVGQLLWAAQGKTADWGGRTAPSAGATYPLETYLAVGEVEDLEAGLYRYRPETHSLLRVGGGDRRLSLAQAALGQRMVGEAPVTVVLAAKYERTAGRYGERAERYVHMETGHAGQNIHLQAEALGLGTVVVGAFRDEEVKRVLGIEEEPLYLMPVGRK